jgi:pyruvate/2-oxoglutarate dehydrogenase complex dihydrolipoamide dehydrogenase (E3) component
MVRSILLRGFDSDMADRVGKYMESHGQKFLKKCIPTKFSKTEDGKILVQYHRDEFGDTATEIYDTVLLAIGRSPDTTLLGVKDLGIQLAKSGKIITDESEKSNIENIFAIGDCAEGRPELTPPAIMAGKLLARRLYNGKSELMDYDNIATTVFTPLEYGAVGLSEEAAFNKYIFINVDSAKKI